MAINGSIFQPRCVPALAHSENRTRTHGDQHKLPKLFKGIFGAETRRQLASGTTQLAVQ